jgi:streptogramin lyase
MSNYNQINSIAGRIAGYSVNGPSISTQSATNVKLKVPTNIATDYLGNVYVADSLNNVIEKITPYGTINVVANGLNNPQGVTVDSSLNIYIADTGNNVIKIVSPSGSITGTTIAGGGQNFPTTTSQLARNVLLNNPVGIALDSLRNIYVADVNNNVIEKGNLVKSKLSLCIF